MVGLVVVGVLLFVAGLSVGWTVRDLRALHRRGRNLTDAPVEAHGVSAAGMTFAGSQMTH